MFTNIVDILRRFHSILMIFFTWKEMATNMAKSSILRENQNVNQIDT